ncbi:MAG: peptidoglycan editing factor PgeF [Nitrospirota bacterium]|nr:peptidoglycan editing factor PgeF [Nitrospirota bacterium]MDH5767744.1 peptidoglycan editing factor PgeF [Nitrospirota bacterium]
MSRLIFPSRFNGDVKAFFTTRSFGVDVKKISKLLSIKKENIYFPIQQHTDKVLVIKSDLEPEIADGVVTQRKGVLIGIQVADCVPILFYDIKRSVTGAVHAGWRGTASGIVKKTIALMIEHFSSSPVDIFTALGPSIRWRCYQVGVEVKDVICKATGDGKYFVQSDDGYYVDLSSANRRQALSMGIPEENIWISQECTYCNPKEYYSYRYEKSLIGAQGGFIGIL